MSIYRICLVSRERHWFRTNADFHPGGPAPPGVMSDGGPSVTGQVSFDRAVTARVDPCPHGDGVLFDLPPVIADAAASGPVAFAGRCDLVAGDFFTSVSEADTYLLKMILHDWPGRACITFLRNCRQALTADGRVLVIEQVIPDGNTPSFGKLLDAAMLVCLPVRRAVLVQGAHRAGAGRAVRHPAVVRYGGGHHRPRRRAARRVPGARPRADRRQRGGRFR